MTHKRHLESRPDDPASVPLNQDQKLETVQVYFVCESCEYRWKQPVEPELEGSYVDGVEMRLGKGHMTCPLCGSKDVAMDET
jgi:Zn finger protein HypA/HybF involved in hydrogenase expression